MTLKRRLLSLYLPLVLLIVLLAFGSKEASSLMYQKSLYKEVDNILNYIIYIVESELDDVERITFRVATQKDLQSQLTELEEETDPILRNVISDDIEETLQAYAFEKGYIQSLRVLIDRETQFVVGKEYYFVNDDFANSIVVATRDNEGRNSFVNNPMAKNRLSAARAIREYSPFTLREIGYLMLDLDMDLFVEKMLKQSSYPFMISIYDGDTLLYSNYSPELPEDDETSGRRAKQGIRIIDGKKYFTVFSPFYDNHWECSISIPYDILFNVLKRIHYMSILFYLALIFVFILSINKLISEIIKPIEGLSRSMKEFEEHDFERVPKAFPREDSFDEINTYIRDFRMMTRKIEMLITDNYKKRIKLHESEYRALQAQINPHFLYNTFDSINWIAQMNNEDEISSMVVSLSQLLRNTINNTDKLVTLSEEMKLLSYYLRIQKNRFGDKLIFQPAIPEDLLAFRVPKMILQPLVENSINYGLEESLHDCSIEVKGELKADHIEISVADDGPGMGYFNASWVRECSLASKGSGFGLSNIDERIRIVFGDQYGARIDSSSQAGTVITLHLPRIEDR